MKFTALLIALPLALGAGPVLADSTTKTETTTTNPIKGTSESSSSMEHRDGISGKSVEKRSSVKENPDGSVSTESSKKVVKPN